MTTSTFSSPSGSLTRELIIYGASDDLIEVRGAQHAEWPAWRGWRGRVTAPDGARLLLAAALTDTWELTVSNGSTPAPDWPIRYGRRGDYDPRTVHVDEPALIIDAPAGSVVEHLSYGKAVL